MSTHHLKKLQRKRKIKKKFFFPCGKNSGITILTLIHNMQHLPQFCFQSSSVPVLIVRCKQVPIWFPKQVWLLEAENVMHDFFIAFLALGFVLVLFYYFATSAQDLYVYLKDSLDSTNLVPYGKFTVAYFT